MFVDIVFEREYPEFVEDEVVWDGHDGRSIADNFVDASFMVEVGDSAVTQNDVSLRISGLICSGIDRVSCNTTKDDVRAIAASNDIDVADVSIKRLCSGDASINFVCNSPDISDHNVIVYNLILIGGDNISPISTEDNVITFIRHDYVIVADRRSDYFNRSQDTDMAGVT